MGGLGSGQWQVGRNMTQDHRQLDVRQLQRGGFLENRQSLEWAWRRDGETVASIQIRTDADRLHLVYRHRRNGEVKRMDYPVSLNWTSCHLGGRRAWFLCPASGCGRRVAILYIGAAGIFACRHCYQLAYACQRETAGLRAERRLNAVKRKLGWMDGALNPAGGKPKGQHWQTYERVRAQHDVMAGAVLAGLAAQTGMITDRLDVAGANQ